MKKFASLFLALLMLASVMTVGASAAFTDEASIAYPDAVNKIAELGIVGGYGDGSFGAKGTLSRGAAAKIITGMMLSADEIAALPKGEDPYPDVKADSTFGPYISYLKEKGVIGGYADGTFKPSNDLSAIAFLKMLMGALGYSAEVEGFYGDNSSSKVLVKAMALNLSAGRNGFLTVESGCTREEACLYAYNALECDMVEYKDGKAVPTGKTYYETKFPEAYAAEKAAEIADKVVNEGDKLLTVTQLYTQANKDRWVVAVVFPEAATMGADGVAYKSTNSEPAAPDSDFWTCTIWDKEGGTLIGSYTAETTKAAGESQNLAVPVPNADKYVGGSAYTEVVVTYVDDAGNMTARYSYKQTYNNLPAY